MMSARLFLTSLAFTVVVLAQQSALERAWNLAASGKRAEAIDLLNRFVQNNPADADAHLLLGSLLMEQGDRMRSIEELQAGVRLSPHSEEAVNALGEAYKKFGDTPSAQKAFEQALALKPNYAVGHLNLGDTLLAQNDLTGAAAHLDRAISLLDKKDDAADAHYLRAKVFSAQNQPGTAAKQLELAVKLRPNFAQAWSDLGQARKTLFDDAGAVAAFDRAVTLNPNDAVAQYRLGAEYLHQGNNREAIKHLQASNKLSPADQSTLNSLQMALRQSGDTAGANQIRKQLVDLLAERDRINQNKLRAVRINNEGATLEQSGNLKAALAKYKEAATLDPDHEGIQINYAVALLRVGEWADGLNLLHDLSLKDPANAQLKAALKDALHQAPPALQPSWKGDIH